MKSEVFTNSSESESEEQRSSQSPTPRIETVSDIPGEYMMTGALSAEDNSSEDLTMETPDEWTDMDDEEKQKMTDHPVLNQAANSAHVKPTLENPTITHHIRSPSSSDQLIAENSSSIHHIKDNATLSEKSYESAEEWMSFDG
jgi:hypothetical protein